LSRRGPRALPNEFFVLVAQLEGRGGGEREIFGIIGEWRGDKEEGRPPPANLSLSRGEEGGGLASRDWWGVSTCL